MPHTKVDAEVVELLDFDVVVRHVSIMVLFQLVELIYFCYLILDLILFVLIPLSLSIILIIIRISYDLIFLVLSLNLFHFSFLFQRNGLLSLCLLDHVFSNFVLVFLLHLIVDVVLDFVILLVIGFPLGCKLVESLLAGFGDLVLAVNHL
jgi:hypothetical protein